MLFAESGAGKTSLLTAGLQPVLEDEAFRILPITRVSGIEQRSDANIYMANALSRWGKDEDQWDELEQSLADVLAAQDRPSDEDGEPIPTILAFDQFEELFTAYPDRWADRADYLIN